MDLALIFLMVSGRASSISVSAVILWMVDMMSLCSMEGIDDTEEGWFCSSCVCECEYLLSQVAKDC